MNRETEAKRTTVDAVFVRLQNFSDGINFGFGAPGSEALEHCESLLLQASKALLDRPIENHSDVCSYGPNQGDAEFREEFANWLTQQYGSTVDSSNLMVTAGSTHGLHLVLTLLMTSPCPIFVEDPTFFYAFRIMRDDLKRNVITVPCDKEGVCPDLLEEALVKQQTLQESEVHSRPYWAMVYLITVFQNPTGISYSEERCRRLVRLARKYKVLLVTDDVYNLIHFDHKEPRPPPRLLAFDNMADEDYGEGHVVSLGSFSKFLAPSIRLGWIEGPNQIIQQICESNLAWSGGCFNHYISKLVNETIKSGQLDTYVDNLRELYKDRATAVCRTLRECLPPQCTFEDPKGGYFIWLTFPVGTDVLDLTRFAMEKYKVAILPGQCCSPTESSSNCGRLSISKYGVEVLQEGAEQFAKACVEYFQRNERS